MYINYEIRISIQFFWEVLLEAIKKVGSSLLPWICTLFMRFDVGCREIKLITQYTSYSAHTKASRCHIDLSI